MSGDALLKQAQDAQKAGDTRTAIELVRRFLSAHQPGHPQASLLYGLLLTSDGQHQVALEVLQPLAGRFPDVPAVAVNLGEVLRRLGRFDEAIHALNRAKSLAPDLAPVWFNRALALRGSGRLDEALEEYSQALERWPEHGDGWYNLGNAQFEAGQEDAAETSYRRALTLLPLARHAKVLNNLGSVLLMQDRLPEAETTLTDAVALAPDYADAYLNLAMARERMGKLEAASKGYRLVTSLKPDHWWQALRADCLLPVAFESTLAIDQWRSDFATTIERWRGRPGQLDPAWLHHSGIEPPAAMMYQGRNDRTLKIAYADMLAERLPQFEPPAPRSGYDKPRIGFVVSHGHEAIFARSVKGMLQQLDPGRYEIVVAVTRPAFKRLQQLLPIASLHWLALSQQVDQAAEQLREIRLDVLYHWEVGSDSFNYFLPWFRPAPVQYTSWAWPTTTGIPAMDYFLSSALVEPESSNSFYRENLLCMPGNMFTWAEPPQPPSTTYKRADFGLSEHDHLYLCHQNPRKLHPDFDTLIAGILDRDPSGHLILITSQEGTETDALRARLEPNLGKNTGRIHFLPRMSRERYLGLLLCVDVALDPPHYSGANTSFDAIGLGLPVVTQASPLLRGSFTAGLYRRMGQTGLIARDEEHYIDLATSLTKDKALRAHWREILLTCGPAIFHDTRAVTELEGAWAAMLDPKPSYTCRLKVS